MKITIESTTAIVDLNGEPVRVWQGATEKGLPIVVLVALVGVERAEDCAELERELLEQAPPRADVAELFPPGVSLKR